LRVCFIPDWASAGLGLREVKTLDGYQAFACSIAGLRSGSAFAGAKVRRHSPDEGSYSER